MADDLQAAVEKALMKELAGIAKLEPADRHKMISAGIKLLAVKGRLLTGEHGSAFLDDETDNTVE